MMFQRINVRHHVNLILYYVTVETKEFTISRVLSILFPLIFSECENFSIVKMLLRGLLLSFVKIIFKRSGVIIKYLLKISYTIRATNTRNLHARSL